jgi:hypothetical protein
VYQGCKQQWLWQFGSDCAGGCSKYSDLRHVSWRADVHYTVDSVALKHCRMCSTSKTSCIHSDVIHLSMSIASLRKFCDILGLSKIKKMFSTSFLFLHECIVYVNVAPLRFSEVKRPNVFFQDFRVTRCMSRPRTHLHNFRSFGHSVS